MPTPNANKPWTPADCRTLTAALDDGHAIATIAKQLGRTAPAVRLHAAQHHDWTRQKAEAKR